MQVHVRLGLLSVRTSAGLGCLQATKWGPNTNTTPSVTNKQTATFSTFSLCFFFSSMLNVWSCIVRMQMINSVFKYVFFNKKFLVKIWVKMIWKLNNTHLFRDSPSRDIKSDLTLNNLPEPELIKKINDLDPKWLGTGLTQND